MRNLPTIFRFCIRNLPISNLPIIFRFKIVILPIVKSNDFRLIKTGNRPINQPTEPFVNQPSQPSDNRRMQNVNRQIANRRTCSSRQLVGMIEGNHYL